MKDGCDEIWLTSEDNGCYGVDIGTDLATLLKKVCEINGSFKIRVGMMNPTYVMEEKLLSGLIEAYKSEKVSKFLHLPIPTPAFTATGSVISFIHCARRNKGSQAATAGMCR